jgi:hypothetical protein
MDGDLLLQRALGNQLEHLSGAFLADPAHAVGSIGEISGPIGGIKATFDSARIILLPGYVLVTTASAGSSQSSGRPPCSGPDWLCARW